MAKPSNSCNLYLSATDVLVSCSVCQDTLSNIYAEDDGNLGLRKSDDPHNGRITKLWLTECAHLTCGKHLEGGGVRFHADHEVPRAPCPLCTLEKNDRTERALFFVNGIAKGDYDENIPEGYFQTPPKGDAAQRASQQFQYVSLLRYSLKTAQKAFRSEAALLRWEDKKAEIVRSLSTVAPLRDELIRAGQRLLSLGQDISSIEATLNSVGTSLASHPIHQQHRQTQKEDRHFETNSNPSGSLHDVELRLAQGSAADLDALSEAKHAELSHNHSRSSQSDLVAQQGFSSKRKHAKTLSGVEQQMDYALGGNQRQKGQSRDLMPPPPIPMQQPDVFTAGFPAQDVHEVLPQYGGGSRSQSRMGPVTPHHQRNASDLPRMVLTSRGNMPPPASVTVNHGGNPSPFGLRPPAPQMHTNRGPPLDHTFSPSIITRHKSQSDGSLPSGPSSANSIGNIARRRTRPYDGGSLQYPLELDDRAIHPYAHSSRWTSRLGLSSNARSSGHQTSKSPSSPSSHRRPLGQNTSASPHFLPRRLSNSTSMSSLRGQQSTSTSLTNSYSSTTTTLVGSRERDNLSRAPESCPELDHGGIFVNEPGAPTFRRPDPSRERLPTADAEASGRRRTAKR